MPKVEHEALLEEVRDIVRDLRQRDSEASSLAGWAEKLKRRTGYSTLKRTVKRHEDDNKTIDLGYVLACAIAADVEIVLGKDPRVIPNDVEARTRDFMRTLRRAAREQPSITPSAVDQLQGIIDHQLLRALPRAG